MATDTVDTSDQGQTSAIRRARGTSSPQERLGRAQSTLRGLAADVLGNPNPAVTDAYRALLSALQTLVNLMGEDA